MEKHLTIAQTAEKLGVHENTVRRMLPMLRATDLTHGRGKRRMIRIPEDAVEEYLREGLILPPDTTKPARPTTYHFERRRA